MVVIALVFGAVYVGFAVFIWCLCRAGRGN